MRPPCHNRPPRAAGTWEPTCRKAAAKVCGPLGRKPVLRWRPTAFEDRCATWDGRGIGPKGEPYPQAHGWDCSGCRWLPTELSTALAPERFMGEMTLDGKRVPVTMVREKAPASAIGPDRMKAIRNPIDWLMDVDLAPEIEEPLRLTFRRRVAEFLRLHAPQHSTAEVTATDILERRRDAEARARARFLDFPEELGVEIDRHFRNTPITADSKL